jgi:hypothetical protein
MPLPLPVDTQGAVSIDPKSWRYPLAKSKWVYWDLKGSPAGLVHAGKYGNHDLYVAAGPLQDFLVWITGATANTSGGGKAAGGGGLKGATGLEINPIQ